MATTGTRKRNPRRVILEQLRASYRRLDGVRGMWDVTGQVYKSDGSGVRKRQSHEYPETKFTYWAATCHELDALIEELTTARRLAYKQYDELRPRVGDSALHISGELDARTVIRVDGHDVWLQGFGDDEIGPCPVLNYRYHRPAIKEA